MIPLPIRKQGTTVENPYDTLGVPSNATKDQIEKAYRDKARKTHPDAGGDSDQFKTIARAREILVCDERRKRFDETGDTGDRPRTAASAAEAMVAGMVQEAFMQEGRPPIRWMCDQIDKRRYDMKRAVEQAKQQRSKMATKIDKFTSDNRKTKNKQGLEFVTGVLTAAMANLDMTIARTEADIATCTEALTLLNDLQSDRSGPFGTRVQPQGWGTTTSTWIHT